MKKLILAVFIVMFACGVAFSQDAKVTPANPTLQELRWQSLYLQERIKSLQLEFTNTQESLRKIQAMIQEAEKKAKAEAKPEAKPQEPSKKK